MRDERLGTYGAVALVLDLLAKAGALTVLVAEGRRGVLLVVAAFAVSRAAPLPLAVIAWMLGLPRADWALLFRLSNEVIGNNDPDYRQPGESPGRVPPRNQWSGSTFGNLPIGQGLSMTVLQMAGMYQTVANDGVRVPPRIIRYTYPI